MKLAFWRKEKELLPKPAIEFSDLKQQDIDSIEQMIRLIRFYGANNADDKSEFVVVVYYYRYEFSERRWCWELEDYRAPTSDDAMVEIRLYDRSGGTTLYVSYRLMPDNPLVEKIKDATFAKRNMTLKQRVDEIVGGQDGVRDN